MWSNKREIEKDLVERIINKLLEDENKLSVIKSWGENCIQVCDIINLINNVAGTDFKRYFSYNCNIKYSECEPVKMNGYCTLCKSFWINNNKTGCYGIENNYNIPCEKFKPKGE